jgi:methionyl-tRNA synthetase
VTAGGRPAIVVAATPTSNGDLHVGHMAGPYLAGDVYSRYLRATGRSVIYTTCTDDSQTYVVSTARRLGTTPGALCASSTAAIERSLAAMGISMAGLPPIDERYRRTVLDFVTALHDAGRLRRRTVRLPYATRAGTWLYDGLVTGTCPVCLAGSSGGACEACGHPNSFDELLEPRSTVDPQDPVEHREHDILVLPMEEYRDRLTDYFAERRSVWRPRALRLIDALLAGPLPDVPITVPGEWGIPSPLPGTEGQMLYPWIEAMPAVMYSTWWSDPGQDAPATDAHWRAEQGAELVYFHGFDNVYHWGLMDLVLLMAHGDRYVVPAANIANEFYDLAGEKFSTSRNHLIRCADLLARAPRDAVRCYLALTAPEYQRTTFDEAALHDIVARRLTGPWNALAEAVAWSRLDAATDEALPTTEAGRRRSELMRERFHDCYAIDGFSMGRAADTVLTHLARIAEQARGGRLAGGDLLLQVRTLLSGAAPILVDVAAEAEAAGVDLRLTGAAPETIAPFDLPRLAARTAQEVLS